MKLNLAHLYEFRRMCCRYRGLSARRLQLWFESVRAPTFVVFLTTLNLNEVHEGTVDHLRIHSQGVQEVLRQ